ncbi:MAG: decarboxylase, partial [Planctomycetes bacterium]|nr:decarboxylase [Planctomycetota bacterium]
LRVWLPFLMHGAGAFRRELDEKLDLALWAESELRRIPGIEIVAAPELSIVAFRLSRPGEDNDAANRANHDLLDRVNSKGRVFLSGTTLRGRFVLRIAVLSFRTHQETLERCLEDVRTSIAEIELRSC